VDVCDEDKDRYRFGFNGQEKVNEIAGIGNHTTAEFGEFDTRTGRRWNVDPVDQISISNYAVNRNNPILYNDPNGDNPLFGALFGGALDAAFQIVMISMNDDMTFENDFSWTSVGISMAAGATGVGLSNVVQRNVTKMAMGKVAAKVVAATADVGANTALGIVEDVVKDYAKDGRIDNDIDILGNAAQAIVGKGVGDFVETKVAKEVANSPTAQQLEKKAKQLEQKARNNPKKSPNTNRNKSATEARDKHTKYVDGKSVKAGIVAAGSSGTAAKEGVNAIPDGTGNQNGKLQAPPPCFVAGTLVATNKGYIAIENIQNGDSVLSYSIENKKVEYQVVQHKHQSITDTIIKIVLPNNEVIETTPAHSFYINKGQWVAAGQLTLKDKIWFANGKKGKIAHIIIVARRETVYNFEVKDNHNYFVSKGKILVHNSEKLRCK